MLYSFKLQPLNYKTQQFNKKNSINYSEKKNQLFNKI